MAKDRIEDVTYDESSSESDTQSESDESNSETESEGSEDSDSEEYSSDDWLELISFDYSDISFQFSYLNIFKQVNLYKIATKCVNFGQNMKYHQNSRSKTNRSNQFTGNCHPWVQTMDYS